MFTNKRQYRVPATQQPSRQPTKSTKLTYHQPTRQSFRQSISPPTASNKTLQSKIDIEYILRIKFRFGTSAVNDYIAYYGTTIVSGY